MGAFAARHRVTEVPQSDPRPQRPPEPAGEGCCGEGCFTCVFDSYEVALERYKKAFAAWQGRHPDSDVTE